MPQLFFRPKYVWFPIHLKGPMIPDPSGQLAELIVYITSTRVDLYSHQILLIAAHCHFVKEYTGNAWVEDTWKENHKNEHVYNQWKHSIVYFEIGRSGSQLSIWNHIFCNITAIMHDVYGKYILFHLLN